METECPQCGNRFDTQVAPGLKDACPRCLAEFLVGDTAAGSGPLGVPPLKPGTTFHGMEVLEFLGQGGMGFVYKARQPNLDRIVALKILDPRLAASPEFAKRFAREAKALAALNHPNIVQVYDYGEENGHHFLVMEFIDGASLRHVLMTQRLTPETALRYVPQVCDALEYAHSEGVIHRDIKPENILIDTRGNLKIADFGLAKIAMPTGHVTASGHVMGTPHYMAPEQFKGMAKVDHRADIYSLGVVFYEMLTGELPIGRFPVPSEQVRVDVRLDEVVLKALEREPERRYQQASEVKDDVARIKSSVLQTRRDQQPDDRQRIVPRTWPIGLLVCSAIVLLAAFLPWGSIKNTNPWGAFRHIAPLDTGDINITWRISGWKGALTVLRMELPNWLVVVAAFVIAALAVLQAARVCEPRPWISTALAVYGLLHSGATILGLIDTGNTLGVGVLVTLAAFIAILVLLRKERRAGARRWPVGVLLCCGIVMIAASLPLHMVRKENHLAGAASPHRPLSARHMHVLGWERSLTLGGSGVTLPNWLMILAAAGIAVAVLRRTVFPHSSYTWISLLLAAYGMLHAGLFLMGEYTGRHVLELLPYVATALAAFTAIMFLLVRGIVYESRRAKENEC